MINVRSLSLRTQLALIVVLFGSFALGAAVSGLLRSRAQSNLSAAIHSDLAVFTKLPRLKTLLHKLDLATARYLQTGDESWLQEHREAVEQIKKTEEDLLQIITQEREKKVLAELDRQLTRHFIDESRWIRQRRTGKLTSREAAGIVSGRRNYEDILDVALNMHDIDIQEFPERAGAAHRASLNGFSLVLLVGILVSGLLAVILSRYFIEPIRSLAEYAKNWKAGQPWTCEIPSVSPEINTLFQHMKILMENLNEEYLKTKSTALLKSQLVSMVSHELNNSLSVIHAASATLEETEPEPVEQRREKMYRILRGQTLSLSRTIGNLLNFGRLETGKLALSKKKMEMAAVLRESVDLMEILYQNKGLKVSLSLPDAPLAVYADPDALSLVVTNLLSNAIKYTPEGGSIWIGIRLDSGIENARFIRVYVKDTGIGIGQEEKEKIFSGYYRSERGQKLAKGFGIGLSLVKTIIEAHGGRLELESEPGKGSTFSFLLPVWNPAAESPHNGSGKSSHTAIVLQPGDGACLKQWR